MKKEKKNKYSYMQDIRNGHVYNYVLTLLATS